MGLYVVQMYTRWRKKIEPTANVGQETEPKNVPGGTDVLGK